MKILPIMLLLAIVVTSRSVSAAPLPCTEAAGMALGNAVNARLQSLFQSVAESPRLRIYSDASDLRQNIQVAQVTRVAGFYQPDDMTIHVACQDGETRVFETVIRHETTHHYLHQVFGTLPRWLDEGIAAYMEAGPLEEGTLTEHIHEARLREFCRLLRHASAPSLQDMFTRDRSSPLSSADYAADWALIFALLHHPDPDTQTRRRHALNALLRTVNSGNDAAYHAFLTTLIGEENEIKVWEANWRLQIWQSAR
ncbi:MAG: DUF1570 domain-containing protein [Gallionella sp.]|nr:DUF1570 domain-containing protein [Gallionella sp.]MDD4946130.1 DUF1570 domain-containing protein [Gallionella sp.]MDD5612401.1 DUF1570 domain-containing protein [Gallionella sp.]